MKILAKIALFAVSMLLSVSLGFAADVKKPAKAAGENVKTDTGTPVTGKENLKGKGDDAKASAKGKIVDINSATEAELKGVPGIGDVYAAKIIAGRPYANKTQLKSRNILPGNVYEQVKERIIAKQRK